MRRLAPVLAFAAALAIAQSASAQYYPTYPAARVTYGSSTRCAAPAQCASSAPCGPVVQCAPAPTYRDEVIEETRMVPRTVMQKRPIQRQETKYEQRQRTRTVVDQVPQTVNQQYADTVMVNQTFYQPTTRNVQQQVYRDVVRPVRVAVQGVQNRTGVRQVVRTVPTQVQRAVTTQCACTQSSPGAASVQSAQAPVTRMVQSIENRQVVVNQAYTYQVPVTQYVTQYQTQRVLGYQTVQQTVNVPVTRQVPQQVTRTRQVVQYKPVSREVVETYTVAVPTTVQDVEEVAVTTMVPQTTRRVIRVPVPRQTQFGTPIYTTPQCR